VHDASLERRRRRRRLNIQKHQCHSLASNWCRRRVSRLQHSLRGSNRSCDSRYSSLREEGLLGALFGAASRIG
jgi:hypothetical protein